MYCVMVCILIKGERPMELSNKEKEILGTSLNFCMDVDLIENLTNIMEEEVTDSDIQEILNKLTQD